MTRQSWNLIAVIGSLFVLSVFAGYADRNHEPAPEPAPPSWFVTRAREISDNMIFFQHPGTMFCFAISYATDSTYMAMPMATVPCESVPKDKLLTFNSH